MDLATGGAYYLALGADRVIAHPTTITGGAGVIFNVYNLSDAMGQLAISADPIKSGNLVDMGSVTVKLEDPRTSCSRRWLTAFTIVSALGFPSFAPA